ncbi:fasciclin-like arabinogalactan family protein [Tasmannia lanceolata]|uniref:fasciclin-like arabinogalactan family protein n=1 Tax=Tasmannia lanceolata TaxID=3420 RepID=UPI0040642FB6
MASFSISHFTPLIPLIPLLLLLLIPLSSSLNITTLLSSYPDLSDFNRLLSETSVAGDLTGRSSLTLLVVPNSYLRSDLTHLSSPSNIADILRYHVLLQYLSWSDLHQITPAGMLVTTLYQTTGRAINNLGAVNITVNPNGSINIRPPIPFSTSNNSSILSLIKTFPYNVSIFTVNSLIIPYGSDLAASETRPLPALNITKALIDGRNFNVVASMLEASGVTDEFESDERGAGITIFVPTDSAFADLPATEKLQSLPADKKAVVLKFHVLHSYYPLGSLESIVNPVQPTLATEDSGAGRYTLNITRVNGSVAIDTGIVQASITQTVFDQNPVAIFAVSRVLLPKEIFGKDSMGTKENVAPPPEIALSPEISMSGVVTPPTRLLSPPDFGLIRSSGIGSGNGGSRGVVGVVLFCIGSYVMV